MNYSLMQNDFLHKLNKIVEANLANENFGPEELANAMGCSHSTLHRKVKASTGKTISLFIRETRLKKASAMLQEEDFTIAEIAYNVGFASATYFNRCFHEQFGCSPGEYKKRVSEKTEKPQTPKVKSKWNATRYILLLLILILISFIVSVKFAFLNNNKTDKSIAVLPFTFLGEKQSESFRARSTENSILIHLQKIENLRVVTGISLAPNNSAKAIGKEHNVNYILEGDFQQNGTGYQLVLRLTQMKDEGLEWLEEFDWDTANVNINESIVAQTIAKQLNAQITATEKQLIEKSPTTNQIAYSFYQRGVDEFLKFSEEAHNKEVLDKTEVFFLKAIEKDKTFAKAYAGLARVYWTKNYTQTYFHDNFLDSVLFLTETALGYDNELEEAYLLRGLYYNENSQFDKALKDINKSIDLNPNYWEAYKALNQIYTWDAPDMIKALENGHKAINLNQGQELIKLYEALGFTYSSINYFEEARKYYKYAYELTGDVDSSMYYLQLGTLKQYQRNYKKADEYLNKALSASSNNPKLFRRLGSNYNLLEDFEKSLYYYNKFFDTKETANIFDLGETHRLAQAYFETGNKQKAEEYFNIQIEDCKNSIEKNRGFAQSNRAYYDLAVVYAFKGMREEAYQNFDEFLKLNFIPLWWLNLAKDDPLSKNIRGEKRFQNIISQMEKKFNEEQERVESWMKSQQSIIH